MVSFVSGLGVEIPTRRQGVMNFFFRRGHPCYGKHHYDESASMAMFSVLCFVGSHFIYFWIAFGYTQPLFRHEERIVFWKSGGFR